MSQDLNKRVELKTERLLLGMTREGVLRGHHKFRDEHIDDAHYGILRDEWDPTGRG